MSISISQTILIFFSITFCAKCFVLPLDDVWFFEHLETMSGAVNSWTNMKSCKSLSLLDLICIDFICIVSTKHELQKFVNNHNYNQILTEKMPKHSSSISDKWQIDPSSWSSMLYSQNASTQSFHVSFPSKSLPFPKEMSLLKCPLSPTFKLSTASRSFHHWCIPEQYTWWMYLLVKKQLTNTEEEYSLTLLQTALSTLST